jgi:hypothetical protein
MIRGSYDEPGSDQYKYNDEYNQQPNVSFHPPFYFIVKKGRLKTCPFMKIKNYFAGSTDSITIPGKPPR